MAINWKQFATAVVYLHIHENKLQDSSSRALAQYTLVQYSSNFHPKRQGQKLRSKVHLPLQTDKRVVASKTRRTPKTPPATAHFFVCHPMAQAHHLDADDSDPAWVQPFEPTSWSTFTNPCLGLFLIDRGTPPQRLRDRLAAAWAHDALTALRLVCQLRGVRGGKGDREGFYTAALWMHENHPRTLAANVSAFAQFGYIKDLPEILHRLVRGADVREVAKDKAVAGLKRPRDPARAEPDAKRSRKQPPGGAGEAEEEVIVPPPPPPNVLHRAHKDHNYSNLFDAIADFFVLSLKSDLEKLRKGNLSEIGLAAKWCPSVGSSYDQSTELCLAVARRLFPPAAVVVDDAQDGQRRYNYCVLRRLRREVLVPLLTALKIPERYMSARRWSELPYERVPVVAMKCYTHIFQKHDGQRFRQYVNEEGKAKKAGARKPEMMPPLLPHQLVQALMAMGGAGSAHRKAQAIQRWSSIRSDLKSSNSLCNCLAICDPSMNNKSEVGRGTLCNACAALGLLITELGPDTLSSHSAQTAK
jgi:hypothetical protein